MKLVEQSTNAVHEMRLKASDLRREANALATVANVLTFASKTDSDRYIIMNVLDQLDNLIAVAKNANNERLAVFLESAKTYAKTY